MTDTVHDNHDPHSLLGAYALYALPVDEVAEVDAYLAAYPDVVGELATLEEAVTMLPYSVEAAAPAPQLRTRILAQVYADLDPAVVAPASRTAPVSLDAERAYRRPSAFGRMWGAVAAALLLCSVGLGGWATTLRGDLNQRNAVIATQQQILAAGNASKPVFAAAPGGGAKGEVVLLSSRERAVLTISGLPSLAAGKTYEVWFIAGNTPVGAGLFSPNMDGTWSGLVHGDVTNAQAIAISIEPTGGSKTPTGDIVAQGTL